MKDLKATLIVMLLLAGAFVAGHFSGQMSARRSGARPPAEASREAFLAEISELNARFAREWVADRDKFAEGEARTLEYAGRRKRLHAAQRAVYERHGQPLPEHLVGGD